MKNLGLITFVVLLFVIGLGLLVSSIRDFSLVVEESYAPFIFGSSGSAFLLGLSLHLGYIYFHRMRSR